MQIDWFTFAAQIINFLILIMLLRRFLYKPVIQAMDRREEMIAKRIEDARLKMVSAEEKETEYRQKVQSFEQQRSQRDQEAREQVEANRKKWLEEARIEIRELQDRWQQAMQHDKNDFIRGLQKETGVRVIEMLKKILSDLSEQGLEEQTVEVFIEHLSQFDDLERDRLLGSLNGSMDKEIEIRSSFELRQDYRNRILELLRKEVSADIKCRFEEDKVLGFGIEMRAGGWRTGWNLESYLRTLREDMAEYFDRRISGYSVNAQP